MLFVEDDANGCGSSSSSATTRHLSRRSHRKTWAVPDVLTIPVQNDRDEIVEQIVLEKTFNPLVSDKPWYRRSVRRLNDSAIPSIPSCVEEQEECDDEPPQLQGTLPSWCAQGLSNKENTTRLCSPEVFADDEEDGEDVKVDGEDVDVDGEDGEDVEVDGEDGKVDDATLKPDLWPLLLPALRPPPLATRQGARAGARLGAGVRRKVQQVKPLIVVNDHDHDAPAHAITVPALTPQSILNMSVATGGDWKEATGHLTKKEQLALWKAAKEEAKQINQSVCKSGVPHLDVSVCGKRRMSDDVSSPGRASLSTAWRASRSQSARPSKRPRLDTTTTTTSTTRGQRSTSRVGTRGKPPAGGANESRREVKQSSVHGGSDGAGGSTGGAVGRTRGAGGRARGGRGAGGIARGVGRSRKVAPVTKGRGVTCVSTTGKGESGQAARPGLRYDYKRNSKLDTRECLAPLRVTRSSGRQK